MDVYPDEVHAMCGENGAGKSTLVAMLDGYLRPDFGELRLDGIGTRRRARPKGGGRDRDRVPGMLAEAGFVRG